ncbi:RagB/SusD family nutrient uptake outer membrane protein [Kaistella daneshvariae]|uniref:RagB/SusD family nutrient uptake outer membrane protein n=1 Tax=Kaistella daneshvariae TaxID=2487074 RepID=A0ABM7C6L5_9FLAO|nr:RagB/SusD family nutrient uptake outer membrane protein [Kaistella daneshvariae]AZI66609.1 RagB/SusD family nutrient uptake outer membrane protein [Kaistella daneshvariae]
MKNMLKIITFASAFFLLGCNEFLDEKSNSSLATPETLEDNQALLDRSSVRSQTPVSAQVASDDIYVSDEDFNNMPLETEKRLYTWQPDRVSTPGDNDWGYTYQRINIFNTVLYNLDRYKIANADNVRGQALVFRAGAYLDAAQVWCQVYDKNTASSKQGLPLRLVPDMNIPSVRATLHQTYDQILADLHAAISLLPPFQPSAVRPSRATALGYLARAYLYMGDYEKSLLYGREALATYSSLLDYNLLNPAASFPIAAVNTEVLMPLSMVYSYFLPTNQAKIPAALYNTFADNDLRKVIFFKKNTVGEVLFKGNYTGNSTRYSGLATDEIYLTVAESYAHTGDLDQAMQVLNKLLITRWKKGTFVPYSAATKAEALQKISEERRKELLLRGLRWADIKRYNRDGANLTLKRVVNGVTFTLPPNDLRYAIAIPEDIIKMTGMPQNER